MLTRSYKILHVEFYKRGVKMMSKKDFVRENVTELLNAGMGYQKRL